MGAAEASYRGDGISLEEAAVTAIRRWLPALGAGVGLALMTAAVVADGQPASGTGPGLQGPETVSPEAGSGPDGGHGRMMPGWGHRGGWERHRHGFMAMAPDARCKELYARKAGFLAYLGAKLDLTQPQQPLWDKYHQAMLDSAGKERQVCLDNAGAAPSDMTALQRRDRMEKFLTARLDALHATRPPLEALYQSLTPEQRALLDHPRGHDRPGPQR